MKRMMRRIAVFTALVLLVSALGTFALATGKYLGTMTVVNCSSWVSLRSHASTSASRVTKVPKGATVEAYYYNSEYTECWYGGMHGYILSTYLSDGSSGSTASKSSTYLGKRTIVNCHEFVTLRSKPSTSSSPVTRVAKGQVVDAYSYNSSFCRCYYNGLEGYILSYYLGGGSSSGGGYYSKGDYMGTYNVGNCYSWVSLRSHASTSASRVTKVPKYASVDVYYYNSSWAECNYNGWWGYIPWKYLY